MSPALNPPPSVYWRRDVAVTALLLAAVLAWDLSGLDLAAARAFGTAQGFAWRDHWLTSGVLHSGGRALGWALLVLLVVNVWRPLIDGPTRAERVHWVMLTLACLVLVPAIKRASATSCPWDLTEFHGTARYLSHWRFGLTDGGPGHCFPSGHATAAFAFLGGFFVLRRSRPALARGWLASVLVLGTAYGMGQLVRGAHYPSHTLWSAFCCWLLSAAAAPRGRQQRAALAVAAT